MRMDVLVHSLAHEFPDRLSARSFLMKNGLENLPSDLRDPVKNWEEIFQVANKTGQLEKLTTAATAHINR